MALTENPTDHPDKFVRRHIGPDETDAAEMLAHIGIKNLDELVDAAIPERIRMGKKLNLPIARSEHDALSELKKIAGENKVFH